MRSQASPSPRPDAARSIIQKTIAQGGRRLQKPSAHDPQCQISSGGFSSISSISRSEEHTSELQSLIRISYAVFCLTKKKTTILQSHYDQLITITTVSTTETN